MRALYHTLMKTTFLLKFSAALLEIKDNSRKAKNKTKPAAEGSSLDHLGEEEGEMKQFNVKLISTIFWMMGSFY